MFMLCAADASSVELMLLNKPVKFSHLKYKPTYKKKKRKIHLSAVASDSNSTYLVSSPELAQYEMRNDRFEEHQRCKSVRNWVAHY